MYILLYTKRFGFIFPPPLASFCWSPLPCFSFPGRITSLELDAPSLLARARRDKRHAEFLHIATCHHDHNKQPLSETSATTMGIAYYVVVTPELIGDSPRADQLRQRATL